MILLEATWVDRVLEVLLERQVLSMDVWRLVAGLLVFLVVYLFRRLIVSALLAVLQRGAEKTKTEWDDRILETLRGPLGAALQLLNIWAAVAILDLPRRPFDLRGGVKHCLMLAAIGVGAWALLRVVKLLMTFLAQVTQKTASTIDDRLVPFLEKFLRVVVILVAGLMLLEELGVRVAGILAGVGIGGLAIALAAKDMLANIFGTVTLVADHTFEIGHWIKTKDVEGTVEDIGFRSTQVRTLANTVVSVPNSLLANTAVENYTRMQKRRLAFRILVPYDASPAQLREGVARIRDLLRGNEDIHQDQVLVFVSEFTELAIEISVACYAQTTDLARFLALREEVNIRCIEALRPIGLELSLPGKTVALRPDDAATRARLDAQARAFLDARHGRGEATPSSESAAPVDLPAR